MNILPTITEQDILTFVGEQNFQKGQQAVRDGAIVNSEQQAMALKAYCYGSLLEPFRVQVTFDGTGITAALCSCSTATPSYGTRGCEHTAALLLAWKEQSEAFTHMDDIDTILESTKNISMLVEVALDEGDIERALHLREATKPHGAESYQWKYDYNVASRVALQAAERAEKAYPRASIDLYQQHVERLINEHGRTNYQVACSNLVKIRSLDEKLDETEQWTTYVVGLRKQQSRLRTLKEELAAAGL